MEQNLHCIGLDTGIAPQTLLVGLTRGRYHQRRASPSLREERLSYPQAGGKERKSEIYLNPQIKTISITSQ